MGLRGRGASSLSIPTERERIIRTVSEELVQEAATAKKQSKNRAQRVIDFIETLPVTSGSLAGTRFKLRPWQKDIIRNIYKTKGKLRQVRQALITMPRKNGKTGLTAALGLAHFCGPEAEERGQVYSAAADRNQSSLIFNEMKAMIEKTPSLRRRINIRDFTKDMKDVVTGSLFQSLTSDAKTKYGFSASCIIYDELAQAPNRELYDALTTSTGARKEPLTIVISTQSADPHHIMSELVDYGLQVQDGLIEDPSFYAYVKTAPESADPWDEKTWFDCNPALDDFRSLEEMRVSARQAQRIPAREATFRLLYLNQRVEAEHGFVPRADWDACAREVKISDLYGRPCYGGLDLSSTGKNDLTSLVLIFPMDDGSKVVLPAFWACGESGALEAAEAKDRVPYRLWASQGHLNAIPRKVMDYSFLAEEVKRVVDDFDVQAIAFDRWKIKHFIQACEERDIDLTMVPHAQTFLDMSPSIDALEDEILTWRLRHNGNPILTWNMNNVKIEVDAAGNRKFSKRKSTGRIDGAVALAMAAGLIKSKELPKKAKFQAFLV